MHVHVFQELLYLLISLGIVLIVRQVDLLLFDSVHKPFGIAILPGSPDFRYTNLQRETLLMADS